MNYYYCVLYGSKIIKMAKRLYEKYDKLERL